MTTRPDTPACPADPRSTAEHDAPKDRRRRAGERSGEGADSVRPHLDTPRKDGTGTTTGGRRQ